MPRDRSRAIARIAALAACLFVAGNAVVLAQGG
jgi:hypothetical protein